MKSDLLKNSELFIFLSLVFSIFTATLLSNQAGLNKKQNKLGIELKKCKKNLLKYRDSAYIYKDSLFRYRDSTYIYRDSLFRYRDSTYIYRDSLFRYRDSTCIYRDSLFRYTIKTSPHIEIKGTENFFFDLSKASMSDEFKNYIDNNIIPLLLKRLKSCNSCNAIYIVGHTDGTNATQNTNIDFDNDILKIINNSSKEINFKFNSNTDLGLMRAVSMYKYLSKSEKLSKKIKYWFPLSAGPFVNPKTGKLITFLEKEPQENKRRIEIWLYAYKKNK